ncbi:MAG: RDD family protein, partial [Lentibacter algarum]
MNTQSFDLPDPHYQPEFYADVPLKRLISWAIDTVIIVLLVVLILPFTAFTGLFFLP